MKLNITSIAIIAAGLALSAMPSHGEERGLKIGTEGGYPPFNVIDNTGKLYGFDIDIGNAICAQIKVKCEWSAQDFEGLIPAIENGRFDMVIASHSITDDRLKIVDMVKYYSNSASFLLRIADDPKDLTAESFKGKAIGAQSGTVHASFLESHYPDSELKFYPTQVEAYADLNAGRIDAVMGDTTSLYDWARSDEGKACCKISEVTIDDQSLGHGVGIILEKGNDDLREQVKKAIADIRTNGVFDEINAKYFPFPMWSRD